MFRFVLHKGKSHNEEANTEEKGKNPLKKGKVRNGRVSRIKNKHKETVKLEAWVGGVENLNRNNILK